MKVEQSAFLWQHILHMASQCADLPPLVVEGMIAPYVSDTFYSFVSGRVYVYVYVYVVDNFHERKGGGKVRDILATHLARPWNKHVVFSMDFAHVRLDFLSEPMTHGSSSYCGHCTTTMSVGCCHS